MKLVDLSFEDQLKNEISSNCQLANELGTTRVVVSRLLKDFEKKGLVKLLRGEIKLKHFPAAY